jgi:hypothetical protein
MPESFGTTVVGHCQFNVCISPDWPKDIQVMKAYRQTKLTVHLVMEMSGQSNAPVALPTGEEALVSIEQET